MKDPEEHKLDAYDMQEEMDIDCGKALNDMSCPKCGFPLGVFPRQNGNSLICQNMVHCHYSRFEAYYK